MSLSTSSFDTVRLFLEASQELMQNRKLKEVMQDTENVTNALPDPGERRDAPPIPLWAHWRGWEGMSSGLGIWFVFGGPF